MKVALVHDYLTQYGGAERVLEIFLKMYPTAPLFTLVYNAARLPARLTALLKNRIVTTSYIDRWPLARSQWRLFSIFMPYAVEQWNLNEFDLVISDSASYAKGVIAGPNALHVNYCHTPLRYVWDDSQQHAEDFGLPFFMRPLVPSALHYLRVWDWHAAQRPHAMIANSVFVARRIRKFYCRDAEVLNPPPQRFRKPTGLAKKDYFVVVSRLLPYKRIDLAVSAAREIDSPLVVVGEGPTKRSLERTRGPKTVFVGTHHGPDLARLMAEARALLFPTEEDFGLVPVEAMALGTPVIAFHGGGALDYLRPGINGVYFKHQSVDALAQAMREFKASEFDPGVVASSVSHLTERAFVAQFKNLIKKTIQNYGT